MKAFAFLMIGLWMAVGCTHTSQPDQGKDGALMGEHAGQPQPGVWFKGTVDEAFAAARNEKKLVFLYWGAIWCPPCNELKAQIFEKPRFAELMKAFIPVYLDGDTEAAQVWGERFQASGYPTVLVLDDSKKEIYRLSTVVSIDEFDVALQALASASGSFERAAQAVSESRATRDDIQLLAYSSWDQLQESQWPVSRRINVLEQAFASTESFTEKSVFASAWITQLTVAREKISDKQLDKAWAAIFNDTDSIWASREFIKYQAGAVSEWLALKPDSARYLYIKSQWLKAASQIQDFPSASVSRRLWSVNPEIEFYLHEHPKDKVPQALRIKVEVAARHADEEAASEYDRHSVISDAAYLLRRVGSTDPARALLLKELKTTNTPWYYQSSLSALESSLDHGAEARKWSAEARRSVKGRASRVQWITSDLLLNAKDGRASSYLAEVAREFYDLTLALKDGFVGRNGMRAKKVQDALTPFKADPSFQKIFAVYASRCDNQSIESRKNCADHFAALK